MVRWILLIPFALLLALAAGGLFFFFAALIDPVVGPLAGNTLFVGFWSLMDALAAADDPNIVMEGALSGIGRFAFMLFILPLVFVALVGEVIGLRHLLWYAGATALLTGAAPWLMRGSPRIASPDELRVSLVLALTGAVAGLVYWMIAGRSTRQRRDASVPMPRGS
jgi:hypothetical protein